MYGRNWIAWYTTDIPIQDGPYKFNGLPGLILKINDETGSHSFQFIGIKKIKSINDIKYKTKVDTSLLVKNNIENYLYRIENYQLMKSMILLQEVLETNTYIGIDGKEIDRKYILKMLMRKERKILNQTIILLN